MLDIGALDTKLPQFWLKDHLATFLPAGTPMPHPTGSRANKRSCRRSEYFKN